ncbi:hypothetical protein Dimus_031327 [Dionaea muscipula]
MEIEIDDDSDGIRRFPTTRARIYDGEVVSWGLAEGRARRRRRGGTAAAMTGCREAVFLGGQRCRGRRLLDPSEGILSFRDSSRSESTFCGPI